MKLPKRKRLDPSAKTTRFMFWMAFCFTMLTISNTFILIGDPSFWNWWNFLWTGGAMITLYWSWFICLKSDQAFRRLRAHFEAVGMPTTYLDLLEWNFNPPKSDVAGAGGPPKAEPTPSASAAAHKDDDA